MKGGISELRKDKDYAVFFKDVCLENMALMENIVEDDQAYATAMISAKEAKKNYRAKVDMLSVILKKRLHNHDSDIEEENHGSQHGYKIQRK